MPIIYNGKKLIPQPMMSIREEFIKNEQGEIIGSQFPITLTGQIMSWRGSPTSSGTFWTVSNSPADENLTQDQKLTSILNKQKAIENLFSTQGQIFQVIGWDGQNAFQCNPQILDISFAEGLWYEVAPYTIDMLATSIVGVTTPSGLNLKNASEEWIIELGDQPESDVLTQSYRLSHNISAQGLLVYNADGTFTQPYVYAQNFVLSRLGLNTSILNASGVLNIAGFYNGFNQVRSENLNTQAGTFAVSETWIITSGNIIEDFTVSVQNSIETSFTSVNIIGSIQGLETRNSAYQLTTTKYQAASGAFNTIRNNLFGRAQSYSNTSLNVIAINSDVSRNPVAGVINYNFQYNNRPSNYVSGATQEIITVVDSLPGDIFAAIPILFRSQGPIFQNLGTVTEKTRQLTIELVVPFLSLGSNQTSIAAALNGNPRFNIATASQLNDIIVAASPVNPIVSPFTVNPQETWEPKTGHYTYTKTFVFE